MATIQELLERKQAMLAAQADGAIPGKATKETSAGSGLASAIPGGVATGMQGSNESAGMLVSPVQAPIFDDPDLEKAATSLAVFRDISLRKFCRKGGIWHKSVGGFFYAADEEDMKELKHFAKAGKVALLADTEVK